MSEHKRGGEKTGAATAASGPDGQGRPDDGRFITERRAVAIVYGAGMFMSIMDTQIVNVALATITRDFRAPTSSVQWVVVGYLHSRIRLDR
jgi:hypothetical protein